MHRLADMHVWEPRRIAVIRLRRDVVGSLASLVSRERAAPRSRVQRDLVPLVLGVFVERADRVDRGELDETDPPFLAWVAVAGQSAEQCEIGFAKRVRGFCVGVAARFRRELHKGPQLLLGGRVEFRQPDAGRKQGICELERPVAVELRPVCGSESGDPCFEQSLLGEVDLEDAAGIEAFHQLDVLRTNLRRLALLLVLDPIREVDFVERGLHLGKRVVLRRQQSLPIDQRAVGGTAGR